jgi:hypothetical protein
LETAVELARRDDAVLFALAIITHLPPASTGLAGRRDTIDRQVAR